MANLLNRFKGSNEVNKLNDYVATISSVGDFKKVHDIDVILTSWTNILLTPKGTYIFDPEYGSNLHLILFDPVDDTTVERIKTEIEDSLMTYDDRARIETINIQLSPDSKRVQVDMLVFYEGEKKELSLTFSEDSFIQQVGT
ncbi:MAG: hypothetical protein DRQ78_10785 [Epsilonproteobacteria bacterium]|nr:MAG: hypothetical protein DRQ78_10785 [Campylobacterota bacterium]